MVREYETTKGIDAWDVQPDHHCGPQPTSSVNLDPLEPSRLGWLLPTTSLGRGGGGGKGVPGGVDAPGGMLGMANPLCNVTGVRAGPGRMTATSLSRSVGTEP